MLVDIIIKKLAQSIAFVFLTSRLFSSERHGSCREQKFL